MRGPRAVSVCNSSRVVFREIRDHQGRYRSSFAIIIANR